MFPLCRKLQTMHGPHSTCLMTAETYWAVYPNRHSRQLWVVHRSKSCRSVLISGQMDVVFYLGSYLLSNILFLVFALCAVIGYVALRLSLRFQTKLTLYLVMMHRVPIQFNYLNVMCLCCLHLIFFLLGSFGVLVLSFVDT